METWITRIVALMCAGGSSALLWFFGVFVIVPWREGRMLSLTMTEFQVIVVSFLAGMAVMWGALHLFGLADRAERPKVYAAIRLLFSIGTITAVISGVFWGQTHLR